MGVVKNVGYGLEVTPLCPAAVAGALVEIPRWAFRAEFVEKPARTTMNVTELSNTRTAPRMTHDNHTG